MTKKAWAVWKGSIKNGGGIVSTETGALDEAPFGYSARFEDGKGTNPEELIAAALTSCFSMTFSLMLDEAGLTPEKIEARADVTLEKIDAILKITAINLTVSARIPGTDNAKFQHIANMAKTGCPMSLLLKAARITMDATFEA
jgi:osmotically inducible protein OsmC